MRRTLVALATATAVALTGAACGAGVSDEDAYLETVSDEPAAGACENAIPWTDAKLHVGAPVTVEGPVMSTYFATEEQGQPTFLNIGNDYPNPDRFTAVIWAQDRDEFASAPESAYANRTVCVSGEVELYEGVPEIEVDSPNDITTQ